MELSISWHDWKKLLHKAVNTAEFVGISDKHISDIACWMGDFLANNINPGNREQKLISELWAEATESEKVILTKLIVRMVDKM